MTTSILAIEGNIIEPMKNFQGLLDLGLLDLGLNKFIQSDLDVKKREREREKVEVIMKRKK